MFMQEALCKSVESLLTAKAAYDIVLGVNCKLICPLQIYTWAFKIWNSMALVENTFKKRENIIRLM